MKSNKKIVPCWEKCLLSIKAVSWYDFNYHKKIIPQIVTQIQYWQNGFIVLHLCSQTIYSIFRTKYSILEKYVLFYIHRNSFLKKPYSLGISTTYPPVSSSPPYLSLNSKMENTVDKIVSNQYIPNWNCLLFNWVLSWWRWWRCVTYPVHIGKHKYIKNIKT